MLGREFKSQYKSVLCNMVSANGAIIGREFSRGNQNAVMESSGSALILSLIISAILDYINIIFSELIAMGIMLLLFFIFMFRRTVPTQSAKLKIYKLKRRYNVFFKCHNCNYYCKERKPNQIIYSNMSPTISINNCPLLKGD